MKITFIGTSHGVPEPTRRCSCAMIEVNGQYYFIDMGTSAIEDLHRMGISVSDVKAIFLTHNHGDHTDGLLPYVDLLNWYYREAEVDIISADERVEKAIVGWMTAMEDTVREGIRFHIRENGVVWDDGILKVTSIPTQHCPHSCAYLVEAEGKKVLFTGDLKHPDQDFPAVAFEEELDLIVVESAHFHPASTERALEKCNVKQVLVNHFAPWSLDEWEDVRSREHSYRCDYAADGMEYVV